MHFDGIFSVKLESVAKRYTHCFREHATQFPSLQFYEKSKDTYSAAALNNEFAEKRCWQSFEECITDLLEMLEQGESTGVYSARRLMCYIVLLLYQWMSSVRQYLIVPYHWGDMQKSGPRRLLEEIKVIFTYNGREKWNKLYDGTYFAATNDMSIQEIDDFAKTRKRKRDKSTLNLSAESEYIIGTERHAAHTRPATPTTISNDDKETLEDTKSGAKKRRRNVDGSSSASATTTPLVPASNSRRKSNISSTTQALAEINIEGKLGLSEGKAAPGNSFAALIDPSHPPSAIESSFATANYDLSLGVLRHIMKSHADMLPDDLLQMIDMFVRAVLLMCERLDETTKWIEKLAIQQDLMKKSKSKVRKEITAASGSSAIATLLEDDDYKAMLTLSKEAETLDLCCSKWYGT